VKRGPKYKKNRRIFKKNKKGKDLKTGNKKKRKERPKVKRGKSNNDSPRIGGEKKGGDKNTRIRKGVKRGHFNQYIGQTFISLGKRNGKETM